MATFPSTGTLIGMVQSFKPDTMHIAAPWFPSKQIQGNTYHFDLLEPSRGKLGYRLPGSLAGTQAVQTRTRKSVVLPTLREKKQLEEEVLRWLDAPGKLAPERASQAIARELKDLDGMFETTHEYARWQELTTGAITLTGDITDTYTFGIGTTATASVGWSTIATSDPLGDLVLWREACEQAAGVEMAEVILSTKAIKYIFASTKAQAILGEKVKDRFAATGQVAELAGMRVIKQDRGYRDSSGNFKYYLSDDGAEGNMCVMKAEGQLGWTVEGSPVDSKAPEGMSGKFAKSWVDEDPAGRWILECQTALPGITKYNNFGAFVLW